MVPLVYCGEAKSFVTMKTMREWHRQRWMETLSEDLIASSRSSLAGMVVEGCGGHYADQGSPLRYSEVRNLYSEPLAYGGADIHKCMGFGNDNQRHRFVHPASGHVT